MLRKRYRSQKVEKLTENKKKRNEKSHDIDTNALTAMEVFSHPTTLYPYIRTYARCGQYPTGHSIKCAAGIF